MISMLVLQVNQDIEKIFLEGFNSDKELFFEFIKNSYHKMLILNSFDRSLKQMQLQENNELEDISFDGLIDEIKNNTNT